MSITLKTSATLPLVLTKARAIVNGFSFQKLGTSFKDATICNATQNVGKTGTAKTRWSIRRPYTVTDAKGNVIPKVVYINIETTIEEDCPFTVVDEIPFMVSAVGAEPQFLAHIRDRVQPS